MPAKLDAFFESTGRAQFIVDPLSAVPADVAALAARAIERGIDRDDHGKIVQSASDDVGRLRQALFDAVARRRRAP